MGDLRVSTDGECCWQECHNKARYRLFEPPLTVDNYTEVCSNHLAAAISEKDIVVDLPQAELLQALEALNDNVIFSWQDGGTEICSSNIENWEKAEKYIIYMSRSQMTRIREAIQRVKET
jgi:hypothetical protein